jgi:class 3 adenylate cyclase/tetratricopeptide (TPR) repeat protein
MAVSCPACGFASPAAATFCGGCGRPLPAPVLADTPRPRHGRREGERKIVTVLFADMCASLEQLAGHDPEEAAHVLDPVVEAMVEAVRHYEGTVAQVLGDGIMAVFGAPVAQENHAVRACRAALRMQAAVGRLAATRADQGQAGPRIRVGLNSGEVVVGVASADYRADYTILGQTTHVAARMEQLARPGTVLATAHTVELAEGFVEVHPLGRMPVKGLTAPVEVYEVVSSGPARSRLQAARGRGLSRFVGRQREWAALEAALERAGAGHGQAIALQGEPGVGKSRLAEEFLRSRAVGRWDVLRCQPLTYRATPPYAPVIAMLRRYFAVPPGAAPADALARIAERLRPLGEGIPSAPAAACASLLDLPPEDAGWAALDPRERRRLIRDAVLGILVRESHRTPVALLLEDLHRMDSETLALADALVDRLEGERLLVIATARPEHAVRWTRPWASVLAVDPLARGQAAELLDVLLGGDPSLAGIKADLLERTGGNPLFIEESVRSLAERRVVTGSQGDHRAGGSTVGTEVPETVRAMIAARIDRLSAGAKAAVQCAAVVGRDVPREVLQRVGDASAAGLAAALDELVAAGFLEPAADGEEGEAGDPPAHYRFRHALTHDVAYATVLLHTRRDLHARVAEVMEALWADRLDAHAEQLAHHAMCGELHERAVTFLRRAAARAAARSAHRESVAALDEVLRALDRLPPSPEHLAARIDAVVDMRASLAALGAFDRALPLLEQALAAAEALGDRRRAGWMRAYMAQSHYTLGEQAAAIRSATEALAAGEALGDVALQAGALAGLGQAHHMIGAHTIAERHLRRALQLMDGPLGEQPHGFAGVTAGVLRVWLVNALLPAARFDEAGGVAREAIALAERAESPWTLAASHLALGLVALARGEGATAAPPLDRGLAIAREYEITAWTPMLLCATGLARARSGRTEEGRARIREGLRVAEGLGIRSRQSLRFIWLAEACLRGRDLAAARDAVGQAEILAERHGERGYAGWARFMGGELCRLEGGDPAGAARLYAAAMAVAVELAMPALVAATSWAWAACGSALAAPPRPASASRGRSPPSRPSACRPAPSARRASWPAVRPDARPLAAMSDGGQEPPGRSRLGASRMFADMDREISPDEPDLEKLVGIGTRHGLSVAAEGADGA